MDADRGALLQHIDVVRPGGDRRDVLPQEVGNGSGFRPIQVGGATGVAAEVVGREAVAVGQVEGRRTLQNAI
jgi:hypothetical protein